MKFLLATIILVLASVCNPTIAQAAFIDTPSYRQCSALASANPRKGVAFANDLLTGGGETIASFHCRAMAYYTMGKYDASAKDLSRVYALTDKSQLSLRSYITRQAARALSKSGDVDRALASLQREFWAIQDTEEASDTIKERLSSELLIDRAQLFTDTNKLTRAIQELDHANNLMPENDRILLARAKLFERLEAYAQATKDLEMVLKHNPRHTEARSLLKMLRKKSAN